MESTGPSSTACAKLMCWATPGLYYSSSCTGTPPISTTLGAAHLIATHPRDHVDVLFGLATANTPFSPSLAKSPDGWEIALNFAPSGIPVSGPVALDASGNVFVADCSRCSSLGSYGGVSKLTASSNYRTGFNFAPAGAKFNFPDAIALDASGNVWVVNPSVSVSELLGLAKPVITPLQSNLPP